MTAWRPLWECNTETEDALRRVIMAGYYREAASTFAKVGEASWRAPDERGGRWVWENGSDVINPLGFQDLPDFPIADKNDQHVVGRPV